MSAFILFLSTLTPILCGFLFFNVLFKKQDKDSFLLYPFVGLSLIIILLQNLVYLNIPIKYSSFLLLLFIVSGLIYTSVKQKIKLTEKWLVIIVFISFSLFINGIGYFKETAKHYIGYGWIDGYNYTTTAEFLKEYPFKTNYSSIDKPYIVSAIAKKNDRIGQSVYQAFLSSIIFLPANFAYGAVSLLSVVLSFLSFLYIFIKLEFKSFISYCFSFIISILPAVSTIHLENFLSQALGTPMLIISIAYMFNSKNISTKNLIVLALLIAGTNSIYTEYTPFIILIMFLIILVKIALKEKVIEIIKGYILSILLAIFVNPFFLDGTIKIFRRTNLVNVLSHVYPFSHSAYGFNRLFFGDLFIGNIINKYYLFILIFFLIIISAIGFLILFIKKRNTNIFFLLAFPIVSLILNIFLRNYSYQAYKLLLSFFPLLFIGIAYLFEILLSYKRFIKVFAIGVVILITYIPAKATFDLSNKAYIGGGRSIVKIINSYDQKQIYDELWSLKKKNIILNTNHPYELAWMVYFGRNNNLKFYTNFIGDFDTKMLKKFIYTDFSNLTSDSLTINGIMSFPKVNKNKHVFASINGSIEGSRENMWTWLGEKMSMNIYSDKNNNMSLIFSVYRGPANKENRRLLKITNLTTKESHTISFIDSVNLVKMPFTLQAGQNNFELETVYPKKIEFIPKNDRRIFMIQIKNLMID